MRRADVEALPAGRQIGRAGEQQATCPQAFTHLALISAAVNLDGASGLT
jgi:hypothetical protein